MVGRVLLTYGSTRGGFDTDDPWHPFPANEWNGCSPKDTVRRFRGSKRMYRKFVQGYWVKARMSALIQTRLIDTHFLHLLSVCGNVENVTRNESPTYILISTQTAPETHTTGFSSRGFHVVPHVRTASDHVPRPPCTEHLGPLLIFP